MSKKTPFISPVGIARYPHITEADTTGKYADGKFKTQLLVPKADAQRLIDQLKAQAKEEGLKAPQMPYKEDKEDDSLIVFVFKSKFPPFIFDGAKQPIKKLPGRLSGGSRIRVSGIVFPYDKGLSLQMKQVQVLDLVDGAACAFDEMEGSFDATEFDSSDEANQSFGGGAADESDTDGPDI